MRLFLGVLAVALAGCSTRSSPHHVEPVPVSPSSLVPILAETLQTRNPALANCEFLEIRAPFPGSHSRAAVARGVSADRIFRGNFADELFAVAVLDDSLTRIQAILDWFPTPRWNDYEVRLTTVTVDSLHIEGRGATYGDQRLVRGYSWNGQ